MSAPAPSLVTRLRVGHITDRVGLGGPANLEKEGSMHAIVVRVNIDDPEAATARLREDVVPRVSQAPGFVAGYWTRKERTGLSMLVFESEEAATNAEQRVRANMPEGVNLESTEIREVMANA
jgi:hypothetical protein